MQARGAPHYYALVWICNAPVIGVSKEEDFIKFIDNRITCHIPKRIVAQSCMIWLQNIKCTSTAITVRKEKIHFKHLHYKV